MPHHGPLIIIIIIYPIPLLLLADSKLSFINGKWTKLYLSDKARKAFLKTPVGLHVWGIFKKQFPKNPTLASASRVQYL